MTTTNSKFSNHELSERLPPLIREVLSSPGIVVSQVSAKFVRKALVDQHGIDKNDLATDKQAVNELIHQIFTEIYPSASNGGNGTATPAASQGVPTTPMKSMSIAASSPAVPLEKTKGKRKKMEDEEDDEEYARRLQESLNGERTTRGSSAGSASNKRKKTNNDPGKSKSAKASKSGRVKSKAYIDEDDDGSGSGDGSGSDSNDGAAKAKKKKTKKAKKDKEGGGGARGGFAKPFILSEELADVLGVSALPRPQVVKQLWDYIKYHDLQKEGNKRVIQCDEKLQKVFKATEIDMFQMNKVLSSHLRSPEE